MLPKNIRSLFDHVSEYWSPHIIAELNGQHIKIAKIKGEFVWHAHAEEDEAFLVEKGRFRMEYRDQLHWVEEGELVVVPRGVEHRPVAEEECWIVLFEPASTVNTGDAGGEMTKPQLPILD